MLEVYDKIPILIPVDIMEDMVKSVVRKLLGVRALEVQTQKL